MLTVKQAAEKSGVSIMAVYQAIYSGKLSHTIIADVYGNKGYMISESDFEKWENMPNRKKRKNRAKS